MIRNPSLTYNLSPLKSAKAAMVPLMSLSPTLESTLYSPSVGYFLANVEPMEIARRSENAKTECNLIVPEEQVFFAFFFLFVLGCECAALTIISFIATFCPFLFQ